MDFRDDKKKTDGDPFVDTLPTPTTTITIPTVLTNNNSSNINSTRPNITMRTGATTSFSTASTSIGGVGIGAGGIDLGCQISSPSTAPSYIARSSSSSSNNNSNNNKDNDKLKPFASSSISMSSISSNVVVPPLVTRAMKSAQSKIRSRWYYRPLKYSRLLLFCGCVALLIYLLSFSSDEDGNSSLSKGRLGIGIGRNRNGGGLGTLSDGDEDLNNPQQQQQQQQLQQIGGGGDNTGNQHKAGAGGVGKASFNNNNNYKNNHLNLDQEPVSGNLDKPLFGNWEAAAVRSAVEYRYMPLVGFEFCKILNNATFDTFTHIFSMGNSLAAINPVLEDVVTMVDRQALMVYDKLVKESPGLDKKSLHRFACYIAAEGSNALVKLSRTKFLHSVDPHNYFSPVLKTIHPKPNLHAAVIQSRPYRIAYLMMIHGNGDALQNVKEIVEELDDGSAIFLIHVDASYEKLWVMTREWIRERNRKIHEQRVAEARARERKRMKKMAAQNGKAGNGAGGGDGRMLKPRDGDREDSDGNADGMIENEAVDGNDENMLVRRSTSGDSSSNGAGENIVFEPGNVFLAKHRIVGAWSHISLVWMELSGYWELLDMAKWDIVINLSAQDFPFRRSREIHRFLTTGANKGLNMIQHWQMSIEIAERLTRPHVRSTEFTMRYIEEAGLIYPPYPSWALCKQPQWMALTREFVEFVRQSDEAFQMLAFMEFSFIPDESYFCVVANNIPELKDTVLSRSPHFVNFNGGYHPESLTLYHTHNFPEQEAIVNSVADPQYLFGRKFDFRSEEGRKLMNWIREKHIRRHILPDEAYGSLPAKEWVLKTKNSG
ncbi:hypothetical protein HDU76_010676 [Blyttiomyces sp. JEL0837]|nr:hypothetical protein HDU76_010676 [Blyttiomyces sp. JEL0837]